VEEIVAVMRHAADDRYLGRVRAMIGVPWRAGLRTARRGATERLLSGVWVCRWPFVLRGVRVGRAVVEMRTASGLFRRWHRGPKLVPYHRTRDSQRMEHVGIVVDDLAAATEFFVELGLVLQGKGAVEGRSVDRVVGLEGVRTEVAMMQTPDGNGRLELVKFHSPSNQGDNRHAPANAPGIRHIAFAVEDIDAVVAGLRARGAELVGELERYEDSYRLCYVRGPEGIIIELAEQIG
jgi:catechol 2,3-dioxygenase-like lactoylglutathione lyase family enzyme